MHCIAGWQSHLFRQMPGSCDLALAEWRVSAQTCSLACTASVTACEAMQASRLTNTKRDLRATGRQMTRCTRPSGLGLDWDWTEHECNDHAASYFASRCTFLKCTIARLKHL